MDNMENTKSIIGIIWSYISPALLYFFSSPKVIVLFILLTMSLGSNGWQWSCNAYQSRLLTKSRIAIEKSKVEYNKAVKKAEEANAILAHIEQETIRQINLLTKNSQVATKEIMSMERTAKKAVDKVKKMSEDKVLEQLKKEGY